MEPSLHSAIEILARLVIDLTLVIKAIGGLLFGSLLFLVFGRFLKW
jgi:hypothetical protein